jgi:hypothetical protein
LIKNDGRKIWSLEDYRDCIGKLRPRDLSFSRRAPAVAPEERHEVAAHSIRVMPHATPGLACAAALHRDLPKMCD